MRVETISYKDVSLTNAIWKLNFLRLNWVLYKNESRASLRCHRYFFVYNTQTNCIFLFTPLFLRDHDGDDYVHGEDDTQPQ